DPVEPGPRATDRRLAGRLSAPGHPAARLRLHHVADHLDVAADRDRPGAAADVPADAAVLHVHHGPLRRGPLDLLDLVQLPDHGPAVRDDAPLQGRQPDRPDPRPADRQGAGGLTAGLTQTFSAEDLEAARVLFAHDVSFMMGAVEIAGLPPPDLPEVAFAGRSNVGKSTLINAVAGRLHLARASNSPGRTREVNFFV